MLNMEDFGNSKGGLIHADVKPCPFCGSKEVYVTNEDMYNALVRENGTAMISISCRKCDTEKKLFKVQGNYWMGVGMLLAAWNRRVENGTEED